ncbi:HtaA domain-containing protein [Streptomyces blastmyceticus]|uniref:Htaa domain-containing protein n=1 Tax=Streptomyces blastmyceticus TaxID=68180 RepID=A0ABN0XFL2_9ACTN
MTVTARRAALAALATATALGATVLTAPAFAAEAPSAQQQGEASAPASASADTSTAGGAAPKSVEVPPSSEAPKAGQELKDGKLEWGVKQSLRDDIKKDGEIARTDVEQAKDNGNFTFVQEKGTRDGTSGAITSTFKGGVHFQGHRKADGAYKLDVKLSHLEIVTPTKTKDGEIKADVTKGGATVRVAIATLGHAEPSVTGGVHTFLNIPATLTEAGAKAFEYTDQDKPDSEKEVKPYKKGDALDPITFSAKSAASGQSDGGANQGGDSAGQAGGNEGQDGGEKHKAGGQKADTKVVDGNLDWGLSETLRKYVDDSNGKATVSGGAERFKGGYRFTKGEGAYDAKASKLDVTFKGAVRFIGHGGKLDLQFTDFKLNVTGKTGKVSAKVTSEKDTVLDNKVTLAELTVVDPLELKDGVLGLSKLPAKLAEGAGAAFKFGGRDIAKEGDALDPLTANVATVNGAKLPGVPSDTGSDKSSDKSTDTTGSTGTTATNTTSTTGGTGSTTGGTTTDTTASGSLASTGANTPTGPLLGGAAALIAVGGGVVYAARRRRVNQQG